MSLLKSIFSDEFDLNLKKIGSFIGIYLKKNLAKKSKKLKKTKKRNPQPNPVLLLNASIEAKTSKSMEIKRG